MFFTHIFYLIGVIFLIYEVLFLFDLDNKIKKGREFLKNIAEYKDKEFSEYPEDLKDEVYLRCIPFIFIVWVFVGLLSSQWFLFFIFLVINYIIFVPIGKLVKNSPLQYVNTGLNTIFGIVFSLFLLINRYHLHIDTFQVFKNYFHIQ